MHRVSIVPSLLLAVGLSLPAMASAAPATNAASQRVVRDFGLLSADGRQAFVDIFQAQTALSQNQPAQAATLLDDAQKHLASAASDDRKFLKAESELPGSAHAPVPAHPHHAPSTTPENWVPVLGLYTVTDTLAPEKQAALAQANTHLQQGKTQQAREDLQVVGADVNLVLGLAPLEETTAIVYRANVLLGGGNIGGTTDALNQALDDVVFVDEDAIATLAPTASHVAK